MNRSNIFATVQKLSSYKHSRRRRYHSTSFRHSNAAGNDNDPLTNGGTVRRYHSTSSILYSNATENDNDPLTNGGTVVGVWLFHRHGDRAPNRYLGDSQYIQNEAEHWYSRIPTAEAHDNLSQYYPPHIHPSQNNGKYQDVDRMPFGFLTYRGMRKMRNVGAKFRQRIERYGHTINSSNSSFLDNWDVKAYSTNYFRTVMSVQCFLDGLIGKSPSDGIKSNNTLNQCQIYSSSGGKKQSYYKAIGRQDRWAHLNMWTSADDIPIDNEIRVQVRDKKKDTLNAFDRQPQMMNGLVKDVIATEDFQRIDAAAKGLADELTTYLPGLRGAPQAFGGTPSGINWVHANDHFVCRRAHSIALADNFSNEKHNKKDEEEAEMILNSMSSQVCSHLAWRFREWYRNKKLLSAVAAAPFREMFTDMERVSTDDKDSHVRKPFVIYSCHDVTLLAFLYAIGADFLVSKEDVGIMPNEGGKYERMNAGSIMKRRQQSTWRWWPAYSSTIAFELVRLDSGQHIIRVVLNGESLRLIPKMSINDEGLISEQQLSSSRQVFGDKDADGKSMMMTLSDFEQLISILEQELDSNSDEASSDLSGFGVDAG